MVNLLPLDLNQGMDRIALDYTVLAQKLYDIFKNILQLLNCYRIAITGYITSIKLDSIRMISYLT